jgi:hypothetical protein
MADLYPGVTCVLCGSKPAADVSFFVYVDAESLRPWVLGWTATFDGPFCRDCGLYCFRRATAETLLNIAVDRNSFWVVPVLVVRNMIRRRKVARLGAPVPTTTRPHDPGRPVWLRPAILIPVIPFVVLLAFVTVLG